MSKTVWPKEMPVLEANDFCRETFTDGDKHCLSGWCAFEATSGYVCNSMREAVLNEIHRCTKDKSLFVIQFNDNPKNSLSLLAKIWNRAIARKGYVVNNPKARRKK